MYVTSMTQRNVLKATVPDPIVWYPKPTCVIAAVRLSMALKDVHSTAFIKLLNYRPVAYEAGVGGGRQHPLAW